MKAGPRVGLPVEAARDVVAAWRPKAVRPLSSTSLTPKPLKPEVVPSVVGLREGPSLREGGPASCVTDGRGNWDFRPNLRPPRPVQSEASKGGTSRTA